jgi:hypothetical protein
MILQTSNITIVNNHTDFGFDKASNCFPHSVALQLTAIGWQDSYLHLCMDLERARSLGHKAFPCHRQDHGTHRRPVLLLNPTMTVKCKCC